MTRQDRVRALIAGWEARDLDAILANMTDDVAYENVGMGEMKGREAVRAAIGPFLAASEHVQWTVRHIAETASGAVLTERVDEFRMGLRTMTIPVMGVFEFEGDLISAWRDYFDVPAFQRQMA